MQLATHIEMDIRDHLRQLGLPHYIPIFEEEEFTEPALLLSMSMARSNADPNVKYYYI